MTTQQEASKRALTVGCEFHVAEWEWRQLYNIGAAQGLIGPAEQKLIDTFCELVPALGTISYLPRMIRGAVKRIFALAEIQLRLVVVTRKHLGALQYTIARPDGEIVYREFTRQEYDQLDAALDVLERELRPLAGKPGQETAVVPVLDDASVATTVTGPSPGPVNLPELQQAILDMLENANRPLTREQISGKPGPSKSLTADERPYAQRIAALATTTRAVSDAINALIKIGLVVQLGKNEGVSITEPGLAFNDQRRQRAGNAQVTRR